MTHRYDCSRRQKSMHRPPRSQSPYRVGSGPFGPLTSRVGRSGRRGSDTGAPAAGAEPGKGSGVAGLGMRTGSFTAGKCAKMPCLFHQRRGPAPRPDAQRDSARSAWPAARLRPGPDQLPAGPANPGRAGRQRTRHDPRRLGRRQGPAARAGTSFCLAGGLLAAAAARSAAGRAAPPRHVCSAREGRDQRAGAGGLGPRARAGRAGICRARPGDARRLPAAPMAYRSEPRRAGRPGRGTQTPA